MKRLPVTGSSAADRSPAARPRAALAALLAALGLLPGCGTHSTAPEFTAPSCSTPSTAFQPEPHQRQLHDLLAARDFDGLNARLAALREATRSGCSDRPLWLAWRGLMDAAPALDPVFDQWQAAAPGSAEPLTARGWHHVARGEAIRGKRAASKTPPEHLQRMREELRLASADFEAALAIDPADTIAGSGLLAIARHTMDTGTSQLLYQRLAAAAPDSYALGAGLLTLLAPKWGGSAAMLQQQAAALAEHADGHPDLALLPSLAACYLADDRVMMQHDGEEAQRMFAQIARRAGPAFDPTCWLYQARAEAQLDLDAKAALSFRHAFDALGPAIAADEAAREEILLGRADTARALLERGLAIQQGDAGLHCQMAELLVMLDRNAEARPYLDRGLAVLPDSPFCLRVRGKLTEATAAVVAEGAAAGDDVDAVLAAGKRLVQQQDFEAALEPLGRVLERDADNAEAHYYRAVAHDGMRQWSDALADIEQALAVSPDRPEYLVARGRARVALRREFAGAQRDLQRAIELGYQGAGAWYSLAGAFYGQHDCHVRPTLREYLERCRAQRCDTTESSWAASLVDSEKMRTLCPE